jgi:hypothetical protein
MARPETGAQCSKKSVRRGTCAIVCRGAGSGLVVDSLRKLERNVKRRRVLLLCWLALSLAGALNHILSAGRVGGPALDLSLPHLASGHAMFVRIPRTVHVHSYLTPDGQHRPLTDLVRTQGLLYGRARLETNLALHPALLEQICQRHFRASGRATTFLTEEYKLNFHPERPYKKAALVCDERGLSPSRPPS